jgi:hypothetical protein
MQPEPHKDPHATELGRHGGQKRMEQLNAQERSALARYALRARWHRHQFRQEQERAQEIAYTVIQALKNGRQLPLI